MCRSCPTVATEAWPSTTLPDTSDEDVPMDDLIVWFEHYRDEDRSRVGGKNASLGTMTAAGLPVPPGFAVTADA